MPSVEIGQDTHIKIKEKQIELTKNGKTRKIAEIVNDAILKGLPEI